MKLDIYESHEFFIGACHESIAHVLKENPLVDFDKKMFGA